MLRPFREIGLLAALFSSLVVLAQTPAPTPKDAAGAWRTAHEAQILQEFTGLLSIPNVANDAENIRRNADTLVQLLQRRNVNAKLLLAPGANPVVYGEVKTAGAKHTIVFYAHYDGQPVTLDEWEGKAPFTPVTRDRKSTRLNSSHS